MAWRPFRKLTGRQHVLERPGMYLGSEAKQRAKGWVLDRDLGRLVYREHTVIPALHRIFDELIVNAVDNLRRDRNTSQIHVDFCLDDPTRPVIQVANDGRGLPVVVHQDEGVYVPDMVFGSLLTGSNFGGEGATDFTGGRHGYGAKLCNIFSTEFTVETVDSARGLSFRKTWWDNMAEGGEAEVGPADRLRGLDRVGGDGSGDSSKGVAGGGASTPADFTRVTFSPDLSKFEVGPGGLEGDQLLRMVKRCWDVAACEKSLEVVVNGTPVPFRGFEPYVRRMMTSDQAKLARSALSGGGPAGGKGSQKDAGGRRKRATRRMTKARRGALALDPLAETPFALLGGGGGGGGAGDGAADAAGAATFGSDALI
eukprot:g3644.t1